MPSLRDVLAAHGPTLVLDAAGTTVQVGWLAADAAPRWGSANEEAGTALFRLIQQLDVDVNAARSFLFCDGPGSILGIRTSAVTLRTWQVLQPRPAFAYHSLELLAAVRGRPGLTIIADARKQSWYSITIGEATQRGSLSRVAPDALRAPQAPPAGIRQWSPLPPVDVETIAYDLPTLWLEAMEEELLRPAPEPDALQFEEPRYVTWTPAVHQRSPDRARSGNLKRRISEQ